MEAIRYIVDTLLLLLTLAFVLRLLFQWVRADFRDPMADAIVRVTNWLILPLRKVLPPIGKIDTATVVAVLAIASVRTLANSLLMGAGVGDLPAGGEQAFGRAGHDHGAGRAQRMREDDRAQPGRRHGFSDLGRGAD